MITSGPFYCPYIGCLSANFRTILITLESTECFSSLLPTIHCVNHTIPGYKKIEYSK